MTTKKEFIKTGIPGFDKLFTHGIPKGSTVLIAGGTGSGKTNFCLQMLAHQAKKGEIKMSNTTASNTAKVKADTARIDRLKERQRSPTFQSMGPEAELSLGAGGGLP